ncbi:MAG: hypothetical protein WC986_14495 [Elusimicrobiota bacterium]|jgi:hypothetical protein
MRAHSPRGRVEKRSLQFRLEALNDQVELAVYHLRLKRDIRAAKMLAVAAAEELQCVSHQAPVWWGRHLLMSELFHRAERAEAGK